MSRRARIVLKTGVWLAALAPLAYLAGCVLTDNLGANPIDFVTDTLGDWTLRMLLASLAVTPLRLLTGQAWLVTLRRLLGLFAFAYAVMHFSVWVVLDFFFDWPLMAADIVKRPYITVGMTALVLLTPLALTSTAGMVKRLGARAWRRLHRLVYVAAILGVLHYLWLAKVGVKTPWVYAAILALLLGIRIVAAVRRRASAPRAGASVEAARARWVKRRLEDTRPR
ncbi:MAG: sulfoxide reductase heme-binding subunit YedZ [Candidatus Rokubacteria bacterium]|nr:sulfoxide reductase heme-binding subunit YedZ [Candidatus Rokubacteria bacterium]